MSKIRIGYGEDIHRLVEGRKLILGGIEIPYEKGLLGHSDADCLLHALMDSLLGAISKGDIGLYFPPDDPKYEGACSKDLLKIVYKMVLDEGYKINNIDLTILAESPKLRPYIDSMRNSIAETLGIDINDINIQAMTNEGLDEIGKGLAIRATSTCLLVRSNNE